LKKLLFSICRVFGFLVYFLSFLSFRSFICRFKKTTNQRREKKGEKKNKKRKNSTDEPFFSIRFRFPARSRRTRPCFLALCFFGFSQSFFFFVF
jgi:hypothetical protein